MTNCPLGKAAAASWLSFLLDPSQKETPLPDPLSSLFVASLTSVITTSANVPKPGAVFGDDDGLKQRCCVFTQEVGRAPDMISQGDSLWRG